MAVIATSLLALQVLSVVQVVCHTHESPRVAMGTSPCLLRLGGNARCASPSSIEAACALVAKEDIAWLANIVLEAKASVVRSSKAPLTASAPANMSGGAKGRLAARRGAF